jgi:hypothetical protein
VRRTLEKLGILPGSFYRWVDRYQTGGVEALEDKPSKPSRSGTVSSVQSHPLRCQVPWDADHARSATLS